VTTLNAQAETLFQMIEFSLGQLDFRHRGVQAVAKVVHATSQAGSTRVLFGHAHRVAVELVGQIRAQRRSFRQRQETRVEVVTNSGGILFFFDLYGVRRKRSGKGVMVRCKMRILKRTRDDPAEH